VPRALTLALLFGLAARLSAFSPDVPEPHWTITGPPVDVHPGVPFEVTARVTVPDGYYQDSGSDFLIFEPAAPAKVSARSHSAPSDRAGKPSFTKTFTLRRTVTVPAGTPAGTVSLGFSLGWQICQLDGVCLLPVQRTALVPLSVAADAATGSLFWAFLAAAFAGGLLLNLMPCVFPVLALKLVALASAADQTRRRGEAVAFAAGTFATVFGLGLLTGGAAALGQRLDWGFTFQSPVFVAALGLLFWAFALQLVGLWTWSWSPFRLTGATRPGWGSREQTRAFFGGAILVLATAPCPAPLLGPALGFAFAQPPLVILLFFGVAGVGLATPLIVLSWMPSWSRVVPKPGPWMVVFERVAGVVLAAR